MTHVPARFTYRALHRFSQSVTHLTDLPDLLDQRRASPILRSVMRFADFQQLPTGNTFTDQQQFPDWQRFADQQLFPIGQAFYRFPISNAFTDRRLGLPIRLLVSPIRRLAHQSATCSPIGDCLSSDKRRSNSSDASIGIHTSGEGFADADVLAPNARLRISSTRRAEAEFRDMEDFGRFPKSVQKSVKPSALCPSLYTALVGQQYTTRIPIRVHGSLSNSNYN